MKNSTFKLASALTFIVLALVVSYWLHYFLPQKEAYILTGTDTKRTDQKSVDVFFVSAKKDPQSTKILVFKNVDTGFGFPPYFKFNAADLQGQVQSLIGEQVLITYYGWRNKILGNYANVLSIKPYTPGMSKTSWTRGIVYALWLVLLVYLFPRFYLLMERQRK